MKIFITGATGLFGSYLVKKFATLGDVHSLRRAHSDLRLLGEFAEKVTWHEGDINDVVSLEEALKSSDLVIHAAGMVSFDPKDQKLLMDINSTGTSNLVNTMLELGIKKIIHVSSVAALGRNPEATILDENHKWIDSELNTPYAISKYSADLEIWRGVQEGLEAIVVHPSILLGKISDDRSSTRIYNYVLEENSFFPTGSVNYIDVRDAADQVWQLYDKSAWNQNFILNAESIPYRVFFEEMAKAFGKKAPAKPVKGWMLNMALFFNWFANKLGNTKNPLNKQTAMLSQLKVHMDNSKINNLISPNYRTLQETLLWAKSNEKDKLVV